ncbi:hypothetical protein WM40_12120 [Robbsia andropogonis]|uniref:HTH tetR-type domain-containing protein n=1 Tax=Robbsia andropogonis TaxID=28092 RepID=A0A0F5K066_9BURK|nr:hypothetical protein WM40_12120 [Robbsia andropogonis]
MRSTSTSTKKDANAPKRPQQGRSVARYNALLDAAHVLLFEQDLNAIGLYDIAEKAGVPPASAYHFFPTPVAVFLALAERYHQSFREITLDLEIPEDRRWQTLLRQRLLGAAAVYNANPPMQKLFLGTHATRELVLAEAGFNEQIAEEMEAAYDRYFHMPVIRNAQRKWHLMLTLVDAVWSLSYTKHRTITDEYAEESVLIAVSYCRTFLPENIEFKEG